MGRGNLEPRFAPMPIATPAPTPVAPPPAPLPSVEPAPMPAPVAPLPNISGLPDLSNIDLSGLPGLPQMPLPAPVAAPAPAPALLPTTPPIMELPNLPPSPVPPPAVPPIDMAPPPAVPPINVAPPPAVPPINVAPPPAVPPFEIAPGPVPTPVTPPPLPPREPPIPPMEVAPGPVPTPVTPPPLPPTPVAPPPALVPTPAPPPIVPPVLTAPSARVSEPAPAFVPTLTPEPSLLAPTVQTAPSARVSEPAPEPSVGIETLAPDDFTAPVTPPFSPSEQMGFNALEPRDGPLPAGIAAGPMSTPAVNNRVEAMEANIPLPSGGQFNLDRMEFDSEGIPMVDPQIIQNALADAGLAPAPVVEPAPTITPNLGAGLTLGDTFLTEPQVDLSNERELAEIIRGGAADRSDMVFAGGTPNFDERTGQYVEPTPEPAPAPNEFTLTPEQQAAIDAAIAQGEFGFAGDSFGFTDGQRDAAGVPPGAVENTAPAPSYANQAFYQNMTPEQQAAYDAFIEGGGIANLRGGTIDLGAIGGGTVNIPGYGGYTGTTPRPVVEAIQNLTVNRDPTLAGNVSAATQYGLTGAPPVQAPSTNPFQRPETQQGIGSLAGGG